jgi:DNA-binding transcriptional MerR regulator
MLTVGAIAKRAGVRPSTVRYYEAQGVLRPAGRLPNGYRVYEDNVMPILRFVRQAQGFGFTLGEIKQLLELARMGQRPCDCVQDLARSHLKSIEAKIHELGSLRKQLRALIGRDAEMAGSAGKICPLIG